MKTPIDNSVIEKLLGGDLSYFDEFYHQSKNSVFYNILSILQDPYLSEDILQETYVKFLENIDKLKKKGNVMGYLFTVSRNLSLNALKKKQREISMDDYQEETIKTYEEKTDLENITKKMKEILNDKEFEIVILHVMDEMTHQEIAERLKRPIGSITWAYNNAIKKLRKGLEDYE